MNSNPDKLTTDFRILARKSTRMVKRVIDAIFTVGFLLFLMILFPAIWIYRLTQHSKPVIFFVGLEHVIGKTLHRSKWFREKGFSPFYFSFEESSIDSRVNAGNNLVKIPAFVFVDVIKFFIKTVRYYPVYMEVYLGNNLVRQIYYLSICRIFGIYSSLIMRGETHPGGDYYNRSHFWRLNLQICFRLSRVLLYRELANTIDFNCFNGKALFDHNCIPITNFNGKEYNKTILFLNGFKYFRRVGLAARAVKHVVAVHPDAHFIFAGARTDREKQIVLDILRKEKMLKYAEVYGWVAEPLDFYNRASIFVLPADENLVFCNYSLLEAMERGLVPVLSNVSDSRRFVVDGVNGLLVEQDEREIAGAINKLLSDISLMKEMGQKARKKIVAEFNNEKRMQRLLKLIECQTSAN